MTDSGIEPIAVKLRDFYSINGVINPLLQI